MLKMGKSRKPHHTIDELLKTTESLNHINDIDSLLDKILYEARQFTNADAGSIYLREGNRLRFSYVQNDTMASRDSNTNRHIYSTHEIPISEKSIAGYVALVGQPLLIEDAYQIKNTAPYCFNRSFDELSSYRTRSILTAPLTTSREKVIGVIQIINAQNKQGKSVPFSKEDMKYVTFFGQHASAAIERAQNTRRMILRMVQMSQLRDPKETGNHVNRVGAYAIEIYQKWAEKQKTGEAVIKKMRDLLRIAAMLHDVGKVAIPDAILKKPAKLTDDEFREMKMHTIYGAKLFADNTTDWDTLAAEVALTHHERWDGNGYPGDIDLNIPGISPVQPARKAEEIPLAGRIVALADVYDALISKRVYKDAWSEEDVLDYLRKQSGQQFDPQVVDAFFAAYDIIKAIRQKYSD